MNTIDNYPELILPERQNNSSKYRITGYICRALLAYLCIFGFADFINDSLGLGIDLMQRTIVCGVLCALFSVMGISKRFFFGGALLGGGLLVFIAVRSEKIVEYCFYGAASISNAFWRRLSELGYSNALQNVLNFDYSLKKLGISERACRELAFFAIMLVLSAIVCACVLKKLRIIPLIAVGGAICTLFLYYGMPRSNSGFALLIASMCGCITLSGYDHIYSRRKVISEAVAKTPDPKQRRIEIRHTFRVNSALGGFAGLGTALLALVLMLLGPIGVNHSMKDLPALSIPMLKLENFLVAMANGQNPDASSLIFSGVASIDSRSTAAEKRGYSGTRLFEIQLDTSLPVYMRNWVGIDYYGDNWHSADYERIAEYKELFGEGFTPELLTSELLWAIDPTLIELPEKTNYKAHTELGYVTALVNIRKLRPTANLVFLPSYTDQRLALLEYGTRDPASVGYTNYYDGIFASTPYLFLDDYSTVANLPLLRDPDFADNLLMIYSTYAASVYFISDNRQQLNAGMTQAELEENYKSYIERLRPMIREEDFDSITRLVRRFVYDMDSDDRMRLYGVMDNLGKYREYVLDNYLGGCENFEEFQTLARQIVYYFNDMPDYASLNDYAARHKKVMAVIDYLSANMVYTLDPEKPDPRGTYVNAAETFLFDTGEGYCVQYATSAVMLLRALGIPARYAEGYIADSFVRNSSDKTAGRYSSVITDANAHAWIEVYYDYYGWVQYEATAPFYSEMYESAISTGNELSFPEYTPTEPGEIPEEPVTEPELPFETPEPEPDTIIPATAIAAVLVIIIAAAALVALIILRAKRAEKRRGELIRSALDGIPDDADRLAAASGLNAGILRLLAYLKLKPMAGEQQSDFAVRVDGALGGIANTGMTGISDAMLAGEFADRISHADLKVIAEYYRELLAYTMRHANLFGRLMLKYFYLPGKAGLAKA